MGNKTNLIFSIRCIGKPEEAVRWRDHDLIQAIPLLHIPPISSLPPIFNASEGAHNSGVFGFPLSPELTMLDRFHGSVANWTFHQVVVGVTY